MSAPAAGTGPGRICDLVMKGGITSGVVYPLAVCELAAVYRFKNIGGTSAGAIAAAAAAAAEYGRGSPAGGFTRLAALPAWLGAGTHLFDLFQPQRATRGLFAVATAAIGADSRRRRAGRVVGAALRHFPLWIAAGALPGALLGWAALGGAPGSAARVVAVVALALVVASAGAVVAAAVGVAARAARVLPANAYGLSRGFDAAESERRPGLARWLDAELDALAGRTPGDVPLTFGHLWGTAADPARPTAAGAPSAAAPPPADAPPGAALPPGAHRSDAAPSRDERRINLEMVTTNLTHGRPYRLPFEERVFYFDPAELRRYFPERVVGWMERTAPGETVGAGGQRLLAMPLPGDLPVVVAARLSLSFPLLISAVPLYAIDRSRPRDRQVGPERCWFSDGGLSSNFPVHFFDALVPRWPTFGINLRPFTRDYPQQADERENVYMARTNNDGLVEWWTRFEELAATGTPRGGAGKLLGFAAAILDSMRNWRDNAQTRAAGYRDRVVHVKLAEEREGGLNLRMPPAVIAALSARGAAAGALVRRRYADPTPEPGVQVSWPNHRWVRYRNAMGVLQPTLRRMHAAVRHPMPGDVDYRTLITRPVTTPPFSYRWRPRQRAADPLAMTEALLHVVDTWEDAGMDFCHDAPRPTPDLRVVPRV